MMAVQIKRLWQYWSGCLQFGLYGLIGLFGLRMAWRNAREKDHFHFCFICPVTLRLDPQGRRVESCPDSGAFVG